MIRQCITTKAVGHESAHETAMDELRAAMNRLEQQVKTQTLHPGIHSFVNELD
jgi:hypothetical protein